MPRRLLFCHRVTQRDILAAWRMLVIFTQTVRLFYLLAEYITLYE